jgi:hypothetical protein
MKMQVRDNKMDEEEEGYPAQCEIAMGHTIYVSCFGCSLTSLGYTLLTTTRGGSSMGYDEYDDDYDHDHLVTALVFSCIQYLSRHLSVEKPLLTIDRYLALLCFTPAERSVDRRDPLAV